MLPIIKSFDVYYSIREGAAGRASAFQGVLAVDLGRDILEHFCKKGKRKERLKTIVLSYLLVYFHKMNRSRQDGCKSFSKVCNGGVLLQITLTLAE